MKKTPHLLMLGILLLGLTSCGDRKAPETVTMPRPSKPAQMVKPLPPPPPPAISPKPLTHKVGLLLPLTGPQAELGKGMMEAAEMALFESGCTSLTILPQDTSQGAHQAAMKALDEGAELLLGPVFAAEVEAVKPLLNARGVNLIAFSTDQNVAGNGTFILGFLPSQQIECALDFAKERGLLKIAAFTPDNLYGKLVDQTLKQLDSKGNIQLLGITHYTKGDILEGNPGNVRLLEDVAAYKAKGLDALLIPEGGENLAYLMNLLSPQRPLKIVGSGQWDSPVTLHNAAVLKGGFFASPDPQGRLNFEGRFQKIYGYTPPRIATLAYDATALAAALAGKGYSLQNLTFSQGFSGIDGLFRLTRQGLNERGLAILEVNEGEFRILSAPPQTF